MPLMGKVVYIPIGPFNSIFYSFYTGKPIFTLILTGVPGSNKFMIKYEVGAEHRRAFYAHWWEQGCHSNKTGRASPWNNSNTRTIIKCKIYIINYITNLHNSFGDVVAKANDIIFFDLKNIQILPHPTVSPITLSGCDHAEASHTICSYRLYPAMKRS